MKMQLSKKLKVILSVSALILVWLFLRIFFADAINAFPIWVQFVVVGLLVALMPSILLGTFLNDGFKKTAGALLFLLFFSLIGNSSFVGIDGTINTSVTFSGANADVFFGTMWAGMGFTGFWVFFMTYVVTAFALLLGSVLLLGGKDSFSALK